MFAKVLGHERLGKVGIDEVIVENCLAVHAPLFACVLRENDFLGTFGASNKQTGRTRDRFPGNFGEFVAANIARHNVQVIRVIRVILQVDIEKKHIIF